MYMWDAVLNIYLPPLPQLSGFLSYRGRQSFWYFIADQYGRPKIAEIMQRDQTPRTIELPLVQSLGHEIDELSERWEEYWKQGYYPEVANRETLSSHATNINRDNQ